MKTRVKTLCATAMAVLMASPAFGVAEDEVNLYSARKEELIKPLLDRFTEQTGIRINLVTGKADALLKRLQSEGMNSPADLLITTDAGRLHRAKVAGVTRAVASATLNAAIPATYRDPKGHWFGLSVRARPILYVRDRVDPSDLATYEALTAPEWKGRICIRSSNNVYNQSLVASLIAADGEERTETWAKGLVANLARPPKGGDRDQIKAAAAGQCDVAIANTYYLAGMLASKDETQRSAAERMAVFWPNQDGRGSDEAQQWYAKTNGEYPLRPDIPISETLAAWGEFKADDLNLAKLGEFNGAAVRLMDRAGWK